MLIFRTPLLIGTGEYLQIYKLNLAYMFSSYPCIYQIPKTALYLAIDTLKQRHPRNTDTVSSSPQFGPVEVKIGNQDQFIDALTDQLVFRLNGQSPEVRGELA